MKNLTEYLIINESAKLSSNNLGLTIDDLSNIEDELNNEFSNTSLNVFYKLSKGDNENSEVSLNDNIIDADRKEIEHVYGHALEQILKTNLIQGISTTIGNAIDETVKVLDNTSVMINGQKIYIEFKSSSNDLGKSGLTANHGKGIWLHSESQKNHLENGLLIFVTYNLNKEYSGLKINHIYVRTPDLITIGEKDGKRYPITKLLPLK